MGLLVIIVLDSIGDMPNEYQGNNSSNDIDAMMMIRTCVDDTDT